MLAWEKYLALILKATRCNATSHALTLALLLAAPAAPAAA